MKFTGIAASLAIASTATAAALPNIEIVKIQSTVTRLDGVLGTVEGLVGGVVGGVVTTVTDVVCRGDLSGIQTELTDIKGELTTLVGGVVTTVESTGAVPEVANLATGTVTSVVNILGGAGHVVDVTGLAQTLFSGIESGDVDASSLESVLTIVSGKTGIADLNSVLSKAQ